MPERLLTIGEVAELTRAPVNTLRYWRGIGAGPPAFKVGRRVLYRESDVRAWLDEQYRITTT
jgi:DNA-binding transcriptional MerR regulator